MDFVRRQLRAVRPKKSAKGDLFTRHPELGLQYGILREPDRPVVKFIRITALNIIKTGPPCRARTKKNSDEDAAHLLSQIMEGACMSLEGVWSFSNKTEKAVIASIKKFGFDVLHSMRLEEHVEWDENAKAPKFKPLPILDKLGFAVCDVIRCCQDLVRYGSGEVQHRAVKQLKRIVGALIPETRGVGKRRIKLDPLQVKCFYYASLFQLYHISRELGGPGRNQSQKVKAASKNFGMSIEQIREFWKLDEEDQPTIRPLTVKEFARRLTAQYFGITHHTVSNITAS